MGSGRSEPPEADVLRCADVLGAFGVTAEDVRTRQGGVANTSAVDRSAPTLESVLSELLSDARDRTALVRQLICRSGRGLTCSARYADETLARDLAAVFAAIDWHLEWTLTGDGVHLAAEDSEGRRRETTVTYPETPLADDNFPAAVHTVATDLLAGTDAAFVLLSDGTDRWRGALVATDELDRLRDRYGDRIAAFDRPLLPAHDLAAYVPGASAETTAEMETAPWPAWARERADRRRQGEATGTQATADDTTDASATAIGGLIEEAESDDAGSSTETEAPEAPGTDRSTRAPATSVDGFELGGSPTVSRLRSGDERGATEETTAAVQPDRPSSVGAADSTDDRRSGGTTDESGPSASAAGGTSTDGWTLSGTATTTRVSNDSFGTDDEPASTDDRYQALGAALTTGGDVSVKGLLEDDEFLPELPAVEPEETRIEFEEAFDPGAVETAQAAAEESGFVWVDSGSIESTRVSN